MTDLNKFELHFSPELDPDQRAVPLINVFLRVAEGTNLSDGWKGGLALLWAVAMLKGDSKEAFAALLPLTEIPWDWPDFDYMRDWLVRDDRWPSPWHLYEAAAKDRRKKMKVERVKIFAASLLTAARSQATATPSYIEMLRTEGWTVSSDSEVALPYIRALTHRIRIDDWRTWPPLYPGDRSQVRVGG